MKLYLSLSGNDNSPLHVGGLPHLAQSMKLHLAEHDIQHHAWAKRGADGVQMHLRILLSYHYYKDTDLDTLFKKYFSEPYPDVFADSGGFSAMTQGVEINIQEYAAWIKRWQHLFCVYANLDVIGNPQATWENQQTLEGMGLTPLPVFHTGSDWSWLERYLEQYSYIALGGMVPYMRFPKRVMPWIIQCFKKAQGRAVYHGFGATSWVVIRDLPWYSVDSSSWGQGFRFGQVPLFDSRKGRFFDANLGDKNSCYRHARLFEEYGFQPDDFADRSRNDRAKICAVSALAYMKAEQWLRKRHGDIHIPNRDHAPVGLRAHLVTANHPSSNHSVDTLAQSFKETGAGERLHLADTSNGVNLSDADVGIKLHLADARGKDGGDLAAADTGLKLHLSDTTPPNSLDVGIANRMLNG